MSNKRTNNLISIGLLIAIVSVAAYFVVVKMSNANKQIGLPEFQAKDQHGKIVNRSMLKGDNSFIQFIGSADENTIDFIKDVLINWEDGEISVLIFADNPNSILDNRSLSAVGANRSHYHVCKRNPLIEAAFASRGYGKHYIYNKGGRLVYSADNNSVYENGSMSVLRKLILGDSYDMSLWLQGRSNVLKLILLRN